MRRIEILVKEGGVKVALLTERYPFTSEMYTRSCPFCGAARNFERKDAAAYSCGAEWKEKVLCTNTRDEWTLTCPKK